MSIEFKAGDKVIPMKSTLAKWSGRLTKGKIYTVRMNNSTFDIPYTVVYEDDGRGYWSEPERYFTKAEIYLGGE